MKAWPRMEGVDARLLRTGAKILLAVGNPAERVILPKLKTVTKVVTKSKFLHGTPVLRDTTLLM